MAETNGSSAPTVSPKTVKLHAGKISRSKADLDGARMAHASLWGTAEKVGIHRAAFKAVLKLRDMEASTRDDYMRAFRQYAADLDVFAQGDMFGDNESAPVGKNVTKKADDENVVEFG